MVVVTCFVRGGGVHPTKLWVIFSVMRYAVGGLQKDGLPSQNF